MQASTHKTSYAVSREQHDLLVKRFPVNLARWNSVYGGELQTSCSTRVIFIWTVSQAYFVQER